MHAQMQSVVSFCHAFVLISLVLLVDWLVRIEVKDSVSVHYTSIRIRTDDAV